LLTKDEARRIAANIAKLPNCSGEHHERRIRALLMRVIDFLQAYNGAVTAFATIGIAIFTLVLALVTGRQAKLTKQSVRVAERTLTELESPFVFIKINVPGLEIKGPNLTFGILQYSVANYGRTPATILEHFERVDSVEIGKGYPPKLDASKERGSLLPYGVIAPPNGQCADFPFVPIGQFITENPRTPKSSIFFLGFVRYRDIFRNRFVLGFCFEFDRQGSRWILTGGNEYNYCRRESGPYWAESA
jgi:hypothetical protein